jgi:hypothetical protein
MIESTEVQVKESKRREKSRYKKKKLGFKGKPLLDKQDSMENHYASDFFHNVRLNHNTGTSSSTDGAIID